MTIIDSCIILDIAGRDKYHSSSLEAVKRRAKAGKLIAPDIVFAEVAGGFASVSDVNTLFSYLQIEVVNLDNQCLFDVSDAFKSFLKRNRRTQRAQDRTKKRILPDFYIGSLAQYHSVPLLTRDTKRRWHHDFPGITIIIP